MIEEKPVKDKAFIQRLQSVRGLAALTVAASHSLEAFNFQGKEASVKRLLGNIAYGPGAVFVFFILSGFVLGLTLSRKKPHDWSVCIDFLKRRFFRLFPVMLFSTVVYWIFCRFAFPSRSFEPISDWFSSKPGTSLGEVSQNICMLSTSLNPVTWSLQVEWLFSLLLPIVYFWIGPSWKANTFMLCLLVLTFLFLGFNTFHLKPVAAPWSYLFMCYSGWMLAILKEPLSTRLSRLPRPAIYLLIVIASGVCLSTPHFGNHFIPFTVAATFLIGVIALDAAPSLFTLLDSKSLVVLGDISYSFYLFNPLFLALLLEALLFYVSPTLLADHLWIFTLILWIGSAVLTVPFAYLSYCLCERPFTSAHYKKSTRIVASPIHL